MARIRLPCVPRLAYTPSTSADTPSTSPVTQLYTQADTLPNMPGYVRRSSMFAKGAGCPSRDDRASLCTLSKIASASRSQSFDGAMRSQDEIQARKAAILENMGHPFLVRHRMSSFASLSSSCHRSLVFAVQYVGYASGVVVNVNVTSSQTTTLFEKEERPDQELGLDCATTFQQECRCRSCTCYPLSGWTFASAASPV